ncbi:hypothetical protein SEUCBS139899_003023 [Sporothrix eucalyptigena]|uniref:Carboxylic ester hydrolase n=1 Tax=Sporothrix eucalyptigena TaxID=1812306 RepID=A0ABP0CYD9_9PEZI
MTPRRASSFQRWLLAALPFLTLGQAHVNSTPSHLPSCANLKIPTSSGDGFRIISTKIAEVYNYTSVAGFDFCNISVTLTHPGANDVVYTELWLPLTKQKWNGRFVATGGGGLVAGFEYSLPPFVQQGYASAYTDAGVTLNNTIDPSTGAWAITSPGHLNHALIENFAYRSIHDMTVLSKAAIRAFYGCAPVYSYYSGCSTGGRMGYFAAQHYPNDFDGILANSPAINTPQVSPADFWPSVVMANTVAPPQCIFDTYLEAITAFCDGVDGVVDGLVSEPALCHFNTSNLVGQTVNCSSPATQILITAQHAEVIAKTLQGATSTTGEFLWYGLAPGAPFTGLANTVYTNGSVVPVPFSAAQNWIAYFVDQNPNADTATLTFDGFDTAFSRSVELFTGVLGTDNPNLTAYKHKGGKLLTFHGLADPLITHWGTTRYHERLQHSMGGAAAVNEFYRLFLAPGVGHCGGGTGPNPADAWGALTNWVEHGIVPETLFANTTTVTRDLCPYPAKLQYNGKGYVNRASSFTCVPSDGSGY